jgi:hypothetical protein
MYRRLADKNLDAKLSVIDAPVYIIIMTYFTSFAPKGKA